MEYSLNFLQKFSIFLSFILCIISLQGIMNLGTIHLVVWAVWLIITFFSFKNEIGSIFSQSRYLVLVPFMVYYFISSVFSESIAVSINRCAAFLYQISPVLMYDIFLNRGKKMKIFFLISIFTIFLLNCVLSYSFLDIVGGDNLRQGTEYSEQFYIVGISFNMCYSFSILIPCCVEIFKSLSNCGIHLFKRMILLIIALAMFLFLIRAQFVTAIIISVFGSVFALFYKSNKKSVLVICSAFIIFGFLFVEIYPSVRSNEKVGEYKDITYRLDEVYATLVGNKAEASDMNSRRNLSMMSIETFFENPIFGVNAQLSSNIHVEQQGIGNHATWLDSMALYGMFSFLIFFFIWGSLKVQRKKYKKVMPSITFIVLGFLNPHWFFPQIVSTFLIAPMLYDICGFDDRKLEIRNI